MGLCVAVGFKQEGGGEPVHKHFASRNADEVRDWMAADTECKVFVIYHNKLGRRKANPNYIPPAAPGTPPAPEAKPEATAPDIVAEQQEAEAAADEPAEAPVEAAAEDALPLESTGALSGKRRRP